MNWGKGLAIALIAFAGMMAWFMVKAVQNPTPLVSEDYYGAELKFQGRIDETARANGLDAPVSFVARHHALHITFPAQVRRSTITGTLTLLRPNDPRADRTITLAPDSNGVQVLHDTLLITGRYNALLEWTADGVSYYTEEKLVLP